MTTPAAVDTDTGNKAVQGATAPPVSSINKRSNKMSGTNGHSLNHLLNFTLPPRQSNSLQAIPRRSKKTASGYGFRNKEKFVNAQYRFVMKPTGDYTVHFADPDIFFQWQDILQVIVPRTSALAAASSGQDQHEGLINCPICLSPPSAPRMTKCGHVFCYPCLLHYLNTSDVEKWNRCPICFDAVNEKQLKSVRWYDEPVLEDDSADLSQEARSSSSSLDIDEGSSLRAGSTIRMRLMERPQITTLALPRSATWPSDLIPPHQAPFHFLPDVSRFSRFMLATPAYLLESLVRDLDELASERRILAGMKDELGVTFVDAAETKLCQQIAKVAALETDTLKSAIAHAEQGVKAFERTRGRTEQKEGVEPTEDRVPSDSDSPPSDFLATQGITSKPSSVTRNQRSRRNVNPPPPSKSAYFYYQAASGAPIFLHPLDIRIMLGHFHSYAAFPDTITVRVDASSEGSVDAELRRRCKYLAHMPESADVVFVEADLADVVGEETLRSFEAPLRARRTKRRERDKKDDRARARAEERERARLRLPPMGAVPPDSTTSTDYELLVASAEFERPATPDEITVELSSVSISTPPAPTETTPTGAWGARTFASAARSPQQQKQQGQQGRTGGSRRSELVVDDADEWDVDAAWHELEAGHAAGTGGRRKRANKLVVLGGGGGRRR